MGNSVCLHLGIFNQISVIFMWIQTPSTTVFVCLKETKKWPSLHQLNNILIILRDLTSLQISYVKRVFMVVATGKLIAVEIVGLWQFHTKALCVKEAVMNVDLGIILNPGDYTALTSNTISAINKSKSVFISSIRKLLVCT